MTGGSEDPQSELPVTPSARQTRVPGWLLSVLRPAAVALMALLAYQMFAAETDEPLRPAEINWITAGNNYYQKLFVDGERQASDWAVAPIPRPDSPWGHASPPIAKYLYGAALEMSGHSSPRLEAFHDFTVPESAASSEAEVSPQQLATGRQLSVWLGVLTCLILFALVKGIWGFGAGLAGGLLLALSPAAARSFSMVDDTAPWLFAITATAGAAALVHRQLRRQASWVKLLLATLLFALLCGWASGTRLAGALTPLLLILPLSYRLKRVGWSGAPRIGCVVLIVLTVATVSFFVPAPYLHESPLERLDGMLHSQEEFRIFDARALPNKTLESLPERVFAMVDAVLFVGDPFFARLRLPLGALFLLIGLWVIAQRLVAHRNEIDDEADAIVPLSAISVAAAATLALVRLDREIDFLPLIVSALPITAVGIHQAVLLSRGILRAKSVRTSPSDPMTLQRSLAVGVPAGDAAAMTLQEAMATARLPRHFLSGSIKYPFFAGLIAIFIFAAFNLHGSLSGSRRFTYNVVLISIDGLRADHLGCYGQERNLTPNIDLFSRQSVLFERAFSTTPSATAAFGSVVTGLPPLVHGCWIERDPTAFLPGSVTTLAEALAQQGYETRSISSQTALIDRGFDQGFVALDHTEIGSEEEASWETARGRDADVTATAIRWLREERRRFRTGKDRFYLRLHYSVPAWVPKHPNWAEPASEERLADPDREDEVDVTAINEAFLSEIEDCRAWYAQAVRAADFEVRRVLELIENCKLHENTLVILTGTNGQSLPAPATGELGDSLERGAVQIPLLIYCPGDFVLARRLQTVARQIDILPTTLNYLGIASPSDCPGRNLRQTDDEDLLAMVVDPRNPTRLKGIDGRQALLTSLTEPDQNRLYDLLLDPDERTDILADNREDANRIATELLRDLRRDIELARTMRPGPLEDSLEIALRVLNEKK